MPRITCFQHIDCEGPGTLADILRSKGVPLGKRDFMGALRMKQ